MTDQSPAVLAEDEAVRPQTVVTRNATPQDAAAVAAIYEEAVLRGLGTFDETPPTPEETAQRIEGVQKMGLPWLVAMDGDGPDAPMLGFAYASIFRPRTAYRYTVEDSVYVGSHAKGRGVGRALLGRIMGACEAAGMRQMLAVIGDSGNAASIKLHAAMGFERAGLLPAVGRKHDQWVDVVIMRRALDGGSSTPPSKDGGARLQGWGAAAVALASTQGDRSDAT